MRHSATLLLCLVFPIFGFSFNNSYPQINEFKKITLGPDDQFEGVLDDTEKILAFTKKQNLTSHIQIKEIDSGLIKDLLPQGADSIQTQFNSNNQISFTYFKYNSLGDICYSKSQINFKQLPVSENEISCIPRSPNHNKAERSQSFWISTEEIGFVEKEENRFKILSYNISNNKIILHYQSQNNILSPSINKIDSEIIFIEISNLKTQIVKINLKNNQITQSTLNLPGHTGYTFYSSYNQSLYFSQFMSDTNHDGTIDGRDNSVIWRMDLNSKFNRYQQLTSIEINCSHPFATKNSLYLTCAFFGSLDIYQLPQEGVIPQSWTQEILDGAIESARSYQDRILIINTIKWNKLKSDQKIDLLIKYNLELIDNHILSDEPESAQFYLNELFVFKNQLDPQLLISLPLIRIYLQAFQLNIAQSNIITTTQFRNQIQKLKNNLLSLPDSNQLKSLIIANLNSFINSPINLFSLSNSLSSKSTPLHYLLFYRASINYLSPLESKIKAINLVFKKMIDNSVLSYQSKLYYSYEYLRFIEDIFDGSPELPKNNSILKKRQTIINQFLKSIMSGDEIKDLFQTEILTLDLILSSDDKGKMGYMQKLDQIIMKNKNNYHLRKAINVRSILSFTKYQEFTKLNIIAANWIRDTSKKSNEFSYARQVVIQSALEQAYHYWQQSKPRLAADYFFQSLSLTDDLESHNGYFNTMLELKQKSNLTERINYLSSRNTIEDGTTWIKILLILNEDPLDLSSIDKALTLIDTLRPDLNSPVKYLLIGALLLEKIQLTRSGSDISVELAQNAHQNLMLAADLSRDNLRLRASALNQLGLLHLWLQNFGQSIKFWELRNSLGFDKLSTNPEFKSFAWFYAEAAYSNNQPEKAIELLESLSPNFQSKEVIERLAFYSLAADQWEKSLTYYSKLENFLNTNFQSASEPSRSKIRMAKAFVLFKLNKKDEAKKLFNLINDSISQTKVSENSQRLLAFNPKELLALSYGFLSQLGTNEERIASLQKRLDFIDDDLPRIIKAELQLTERLVSTNKIDQANLILQNAIKYSQIYAKENGYIHPAISKTLNNFFIFGLLFPQFSSISNEDDLTKHVENLIFALEKQSETPTPYLLKELWQLHYLWNTYKSNVLKKSIDPQWEQKLNDSELTHRFKQIDSNGYNQLVKKLKLFL